MTSTLLVRLGVASVLLAACGASAPSRASNSGTSNSGTANSSTSNSSISNSSVDPSMTPPTTDEYGSAPGTPAAWAKAQELAAVPTGSRDCGQEFPSSGFPTTFAPRLDRFDCIVAAAEAGEPAIHSSLSRDDNGGVNITLYEVLGVGTVRIVSQNVDWTGAPSRGTEKQCTGLQRSLGLDPPACLT